MLKQLRIVITGTPGTGKTTVAKRICEKLRLSYVNLNEELIKRGLCKYNKDLATYEIVDVDKAAQVLDEVMEQHTCAVFDTLLVELVREDLVDYVVVLRLDPYELYRRLRYGRGWCGVKLCENVMAEILDYFLIKSVEAVGEERVVEVDTTGKSVDDVVNEVIDFVLNKKRGRVGIVSWLSQVNPSFLLCLDACREGLVDHCDDNLQEATEAQ